MAKVTAKQVITVRHDTGSVERLLTDTLGGRDSAVDWPDGEVRPSLPHPTLARAIAGAKVGDQRMYLGFGRCRLVSIEAIEPAPIWRRLSGRATAGQQPG